MTDIKLHRVDGALLRKELKLGDSVLAINLPEQIVHSLKLEPKDRVERAAWREWIDRIEEYQQILLWIGPRLDDDQAFLTAMGKKLPKTSVLWSFHPMTMLTIDRLTGDAVLKLLETCGLADDRCANTGFGYYARSFKRGTPKPRDEFDY